MVPRQSRLNYPFGETVTLAELGLTAAQLAAEAVESARDGIRVLESLGVDPGDALRQRAAGDPARVAAFVAVHLQPGSENAVA